MPRHDRGFTLIEILVVVLIIGIVLGIAMVVPSRGGPFQAVHDETRRLEVLFEQARERALLEDREMGFSATEDGYRWWQWSEDNESWQLLTETSFREYRVADSVLLLMSKDKKEAGSRPQVIFYTDTQVTPFRLDIALRQDDKKILTLETDGFAPVTQP